MPRHRPPSPATATLPEAIWFLSSCCDGAVRRDNLGFQREHVVIGHSLAQLPLDQWDHRAIRTARRLVRIYAGQLERAGFLLDPAPSRTARRRAEPMVLAVRPGWHRDPADVFVERWWNGARWTHHVR